ncbi:hypothetical protein BAE44_0007474 [Dichanthelium oligosanthes]|uniref:Uncharacterized protein n=1 Tax=Dichanthelium oligosanthes TaxID=888268 RepID=A0A1E5W2F8_9POAL|nr:hypothetical protein BAE44_0007474 [Dichanthelium oligosanthes]
MVLEISPGLLRDEDYAEEEAQGAGLPKVRAPLPQPAEEPKAETKYDEALVLAQEAWKKKANEFEADFGKIETKIHRFPPSIRGLGVRYMAPRAVAIGPYHRPSLSNENNDLWQMERVKELAAYHFIEESGHSLEEMFSAVSSVQGHARGVYTREATANMEDATFALTMLRDGCFLLQFMLMCVGARHELAPSLLYCLSSNQAVISHDIMLLENQIPWIVIDTLRMFRDVPVEGFIVKMGHTLQVCRDDSEIYTQMKRFLEFDGYKPPHLLGLLHHYKTGRSIAEVLPSSSTDDVERRLRPVLKTISAIELQEMGIMLVASKTTKFIDMGFKKIPISGEIFLAPLLLDEIRSYWLINMAAFEICTGAEPPVLCSYLAVLAMLMDREDDVHELRAKRLVQGELTNREMLDFFKTLIKHISGGAIYDRILGEIEDYKLKRCIWIKMYSFVYKNFKTVITVLSIIGVIGGIFKTLGLPLKTLLFLKKH